MKALAYRVGGETYCCVCAEQLAHISGFPNLFFATNRPERVERGRRNETRLRSESGVLADSTDQVPCLEPESEAYDSMVRVAPDAGVGI